MPTTEFSRLATTRARLRRITALVALCTLAGVGALAGGVSAMAAEPDGGGIGISVTVPSSTPTPTSTVPVTTTTVNGTTTTTTTTPRGAASTPAGKPSTTPVVNTVATDPLADSVGLGGVVFISGLTSTNDPSINPLAGSLTSRFTVRNVSDDALDASAKFWITNVFGAKLSSDTVKIADLKAGETRVVDAFLPGVGQWTLLTTHMTFTPPAEVDGVALVPVTRDAMAFAAPWFVFAGLLLAAAASGIVYLLRLNRSTQLATVPA
jgi:hypothetical protein